MGSAIPGAFMGLARLLCPYHARPPAEKPFAWVARGANTPYHPSQPIYPILAGVIP